MAATWSVDDITFADRARRVVQITATRTDGLTSRTYTIGSFLIRQGVPLSQEGDRLAGDLKALADADTAWSVPDFDTLFPNAVVAMKTKLDALEV